MRDSISYKDVIDFLNEINRLDPSMISNLFNHKYRITCNRSIADHPTVQVSEVHNHNDRCVGYDVSFIGIINGLFGPDANNEFPIIAIVDNLKGNKDKIKVSEFTVNLCFTPNKVKNKNENKNKQNEKDKKSNKDNKSKKINRNKKTKNNKIKNNNK